MDSTQQRCKTFYDYVSRTIMRTLRKETMWYKWLVWIYLFGLPKRSFYNWLRKTNDCTANSFVFLYPTPIKTSKKLLRFIFERSALQIVYHEPWGYIKSIDYFLEIVQRFFLTVTHILSVFDYEKLHITLSFTCRYYQILTDCVWLTC